MDVCREEVNHIKGEQYFDCSDILRYNENGKIIADMSLQKSKFRDGSQGNEFRESVSVMFETFLRYSLYNTHDVLPKKPIFTIEFFYFRLMSGGQQYKLL